MKVLLFGATGMVGQGVLRECLLDPDVTLVQTIGRTPTGQQHAKLKEIAHANLFDYSTIKEELTGFDACFFCLGTPSFGKSEAEYKKITHDLTLEAARTLAKLNPRMTFIYVSGDGADSSEIGKVMWARVRGRTENALQALPFHAVYIFRPGVIVPLHGIRSKTLLYRWFYALAQPLLPALRKRFPDTISTTEQIGRAMIRVARSGADRPILKAKDFERVLRTIVLALLVGVPALAKSSRDCMRLSDKNDRLVCQHSRLTALEKALKEAIKTMRKTTYSSLEQKEWRGFREAWCKQEDETERVKCLELAYFHRIRQLKEPKQLPYLALHHKYAPQLIIQDARIIPELKKLFLKHYDRFVANYEQMILGVAEDNGFDGFVFRGWTESDSGLGASVILTENGKAWGVIEEGKTWEYFTTVEEYKGHPPGTFVNAAAKWKERFGQEVQFKSH